MTRSSALVTGASNGIGKEIARQLAGALAPGLRATDLNARAAAGAVRFALLPDDGPSGQFFSWDGAAAPW